MSGTLVGSSYPLISSTRMPASLALPIGMGNGVFGDMGLQVKRQQYPAVRTVMRQAVGVDEAMSVAVPLGAEIEERTGDVDGPRGGCCGREDSDGRERAGRESSAAARRTRRRRRDRDGDQGVGCRGRARGACRGRSCAPGFRVFDLSVSRNARVPVAVAPDSERALRFTDPSPSGRDVPPPVFPRRR